MTKKASIIIEDKETVYGVISTILVKKHGDSIHTALLQRLSVNGKISYTDPTIEDSFTIGKDGNEFEYWEGGVEFPDAKNKAACWNHYNKKWNTIEALF